MQRGSEPLRLASQWLEKAAQDLAGAELLLTSDGLLDLVAFHCQQAVEKAAKGYLTLRDQPLRRTHNLVELLRQCAEIDGQFGSRTDTARRLSPYAIDLRYPGMAAASREQATAAIGLTRAFPAFVTSRMPDG
jgi:HEPN domain-containing protein